MSYTSLSLRIMTTLTALILALILLANMNTPVKASQAHNPYACHMITG